MHALHELGISQPQTSLPVVGTQVHQRPILGLRQGVYKCNPLPTIFISSLGFPHLKMDMQFEVVKYKKNIPYFKTMMCWGEGEGREPIGCLPG